tara:strand:+ start:343 stop:453 length:111 start_codon:yes stop_codon:yes gene_type:complete
MPITRANIVHQVTKPPLEKKNKKKKKKVKKVKLNKK